ncbi:MAG: hypothetical protein ABIP54_02035 [Candidatus Andersenbacteria bacterium]
MNENKAKAAPAVVPKKLTPAFERHVKDRREFKETAKSKTQDMAVKRKLKFEG